MIQKRSVRRAHRRKKGRFLNAAQAQKGAASLTCKRRVRSGAAHCGRSGKEKMQKKNLRFASGSSGNEAWQRTEAKASGANAKEHSEKPAS